MIRHTHHELWAAALILTGVAGGWAAAVGAGQSPPVPSGDLGVLVASALGFLVLSTLLRASGLKWVGLLRQFEAAALLPDDDRGRRRSAFTPRMLGLVLLPALCVFVIRDTAIVVVSLAVGLDWLGKAVAGAGWERMNGRHLWLAADPEDPSALRCTAVSPSPATRTASGALPE
ncbi:hypothetical protein LXH13_17155 [Streptomyces spinosirectus]|jgi:hypothetical protein|uniref:hypothetical protein n=1 Tax=Streptomyces TaxID=1883 RepID=UPI000D387EF5|nr:MULTISPECIES: hypothetical protein [Streptomyces]MBY8344285.1 hypothetical protein [Streptomyces plumbidurans]PTM92567.1 hypothetical protein C7821_109390 [Streptomyces sp. VMFN-G11Ma]UIR18667.1 hypothetical protein LXH13_17155 [Streptomyces spinosirectus]